LCWPALVSAKLVMIMPLHNQIRHATDNAKPRPRFDLLKKYLRLTGLSDIVIASSRSIVLIDQIRQCHAALPAASSY